MILAMAGPLLGQVSFEKDVWPVFEARCVECHRKPYEEDGRLKKPKAGLRLDGAWHIMRGSDDGPIVVAERLDASTLYHHITLPSDDDDIMPPKGALSPSPKYSLSVIGFLMAHLLGIGRALQMASFWKKPRISMCQST